MSDVPEDRTSRISSREDKLEIRAERLGEWTNAEQLYPSAEKAQQIQSALKKTLIEQLEAEAARLGDRSSAAIHGKTGISTLEDQIRVNPAESD
jgi:hypothetical protein